MLRTIRLSKQLDELLQRYADSKRISVGALLSSLLTRYSEWDRYTEKFAMITLRQETLKEILETTEEESLIIKAREIGAKIPREFLMFWFKQTDLHSYIRYLELLCNYGGFARFELSLLEQALFTSPITFSIGTLVSTRVLIEQINGIYFEWLEASALGLIF